VLGFTTRVSSVPESPSWQTLSSTDVAIQADQRLLAEAGRPRG
jgi:hypothetical protein